MDIVAIFDKLSAPLRRRVRLMVSRAVLAAPVNDAGGIQVVQVKLLEGEVRDGVERMQNYGFTGVPLAGAEGVMVCVGGDRDHGIVIAMDDRRYRIKGMQPGEVALYDDLGQKVHLTRTGVVIQTPLKCRIEAADIELHASHSYSWDVGGFGERWTFTGGSNWEHKTWQIGATVTNVPLNIHPPEGP